MTLNLLDTAIARLKAVVSKHSKILFYILVIFSLLVAHNLVRALITELTTPNYHFLGTHYDFLAFYTAAKSMLLHHGGIYDAGQMTSLQRQIIPQPVGAAGYMPYFNPPFIAVFLAPLALLNINTARLLWLALSIAMAIFILYKLTAKLSPVHRLLAIVLLLGSYPLFQTFIEGQTSILVLLGGCVSYLFFARQKKFLSGASLILVWVLPQFGLCVLIGLILKHQWRMIKGWAASTVAVLALTLPITGIAVYFRYLKVLASTAGDHFVNMNTTAPLTWRGALNSTSGINGLYAQLLGANHTTLVNILYAVTSLLLLSALAFAIYKAGRKWTLRQEALLFSSAVLAACIINPHLYAQDIIFVILLLPALFVLYKHHAMKAAIVLAAFCNLAFIDQYSRLHLFTLTAITAIGICIYASLHLQANKKART
jgi:Glycosyltransferase family 87